MEVNARKKAFSPDTLLGELSSWNRQEEQFKNVFSEQALQDRDFKKMKLDEYKRLSFKYTGKVRSTDESALYKMLRFQERKMEKALYPNLLLRLMARVWSDLSNLLRSSGSVKPVQNYHSYIEKTIVPSKDSSEALSNKLGKKSDFKKIHGYDLGAKIKGNQERQKGQGL